MPNSNDPRSNDPKTGGTDDVSPKLRAIFRKKRRLALARQRQGSRCSLLVFLRVMLHVYRRVHRRVVKMFMRALVAINLTRVLQRRADIVEPFD